MFGMFNRVCRCEPFPANCPWGLEEQVASLVLPAGAGNHLMDLLTKQFQFQSIDGCLVLPLGLVQEVFAFATFGTSMLRALCPALPCGGHSSQAPATLQKGREITFRPCIAWVSGLV